MERAALGKAKEGSNPAHSHHGTPVPTQGVLINMCNGQAHVKATGEPYLAMRGKEENKEASNFNVKHPLLGQKGASA